MPFFCNDTPYYGLSIFSFYVWKAWDFQSSIPISDAIVGILKPAVTVCQSIINKSHRIYWIRIIDYNSMECESLAYTEKITCI